MTRTPKPTNKDHAMRPILFLLALIAVLAIAGCNDADVVSENISTAADNFEVRRRVVFYNGITGEYMLSIEGLISIKKDNIDDQLEVTVKTGPKDFKKHFLGLSDNVTYFAEQIDSVDASPYMYRVVFKPLAIVPNVEIRK